MRSSIYADRSEAAEKDGKPPSENSIIACPAVNGRAREKSINTGASDLCINQWPALPGVSENFATDYGKGLGVFGIGGKGHAARFMFWCQFRFPFND